MGEITIKLNGEKRELPGEVSLEQMLELFSLPNKRVAVELNNSVVRRSDWPQTILRNEDKIEVVHFVGGG